MSNSIEKLNQTGNEAVTRPKDLKGPFKNKIKMFVCEEHVKLWITPKLKKDNE